MSHDNLEAARRLYQARNRGDVEAVVAECHPNVQLFPHLSSLGGVPVQGHDGLRRYLASLTEEWEEFRHEPEDFLAAGDVVVAFLHTHALGRGSGVKIDLDVAHLLTFENGRCIKNVTYLDRAEALEAARLGQSAVSLANVDVVRLAYEALAVGGLDRFLEHFTDDVDYRAVSGAPDDIGPIHGKNAFRAWLQDWFDMFDGFEMELLELIDVGDDTVVWVERFGGRARRSGIQIDLVIGGVFTIRDGKLARGREYATREQALEAAGLRE